MEYSLAYAYLTHGTPIKPLQSSRTCSCCNAAEIRLELLALGLFAHELASKSSTSKVDISVELPSLCHSIYSSFIYFLFLARIGKARSVAAS